MVFVDVATPTETCRGVMMPGANTCSVAIRKPEQQVRRATHCGSKQQ